MIANKYHVLMSFIVFQVCIYIHLGNEPFHYGSVLVSPRGRRIKNAIMCLSRDYTLELRKITAIGHNYVFRTIHNYDFNS